MKRHALFVGVNTYDDKSIRDLRYSVSDASVLADRFKGLGYAVRLLADPTGAELKNAIIASVDGLSAGDVFLFFFAGHGFTAQDGSHLLFCRDDIQKLLRVNSAGTRVDALEALTDDGGFHRAFLLDSCRTDCCAGMGSRGGSTTRDLDFISMPECTEKTGSFFLLRSCDRFCPSLELDAIGHGLFTQGLLDAMDARDGGLSGCDTSFATAVGNKMRILQQGHDVSILQRPSIGECCGPAFSLFDNDFLKATSFENQHGASPLNTLSYSCPMCGRNNHTEDTFNCVVCGREHLCMSHFSEEYKCCTDCAEKKSNLKRAKEALSAKDYDLLWECLRNADLNDPEGMYLQAQLYKNGCARLEQAPVMAFEWFYKASESGYVNAKAELGHCYYYGRGVRQSREKAFECYKIAAEHANVDAQYNLSVCYREGAGIAANDDEAVKWCRKAAEHGQTEAQFALGMRYLIGDGVLQNYIEALKWYRKAAEQGYAKGQHALAGFYENGTGVAQSHEESVKLYRMAAEQGHADACVKLSECYRSGRGVAQDNGESEKWYGKACELRHEAGMRAFEETESYYKEGMAYLEGSGVTKDESHGLQCLDIAADRGHVKAMKELAECYYHGRGVKQNYAESVRLYEMAAKMGSEEAKKKLLQIHAQVSCAATSGGPSSIQTSGGVEIQVGNLNYDMTEDQLRKLLGQYGEVGSVRIVTNRFTGKSKGYGFVSMPNCEVAANAIAALNGMDVQGHSISLRVVGDAR